MQVVDDLYMKTREAVGRSKARVETADRTYSHRLLSIMLLGLMTLQFWEAYNNRVEREQLREREVVAVVDADGKVSTVGVKELSARPEDVEIHRMAGDQVELIQGAGTSDYLTRFGYARRGMSEACAKDFDQTLGSPAVLDEFASAKASGREFERVVHVTMRQLEAEDLGSMRIPSRLTYQEIVPRFDVLVEGTVEAFKAGTTTRIDSQRIAYWVRLQELNRRALDYPHALMVEHIQTLPVRARREK